MATSITSEKNTTVSTIGGVFVLVLLILAYTIAHAFFSNRVGYFTNLTPKEFSYMIFPLFGLYAYLFVWSQFLLGTNMDWIKPRMPALYRFHKFEGGVALLFALTHPTLLVLGLGLSTYYHYKFVPHSHLIFIVLGYFQLTLIICTAGTALLRRIPWLKERWYIIHYLNYILFVSVWIHSWFLGTDIQQGTLRAVWIFIGITGVLSAVARFIRRPVTT